MWHVLSYIIGIPLNALLLNKKITQMSKIINSRNYMKNSKTNLMKCRESTKLKSENK